MIDRKLDGYAVLKIFSIFALALGNAFGGWTTVPFDGVGLNMYIEDCERGGVCFVVTDVSPPPLKNLEAKVVPVSGRNGVFRVYLGGGDDFCTLIKDVDNGGYIIEGTNRRLVECPKFREPDEWFRWLWENRDKKNKGR